MYGKMICVDCSVREEKVVFLVLKKAGVKVKYGQYEGYFRADLWECPMCGCQVIAGFGDAEVFDPDARVDYDFSEKEAEGKAVAAR